tara:strand:+ start:298 stop:711 length:414 start_codon:yes stop_codon:yes gene_type:complete
MKLNSWESLLAELRRKPDERYENNLDRITAPRREAGITRRRLGTTGMDPELPPIPNVMTETELARMEASRKERTQPTGYWLVARKETMEIAIEALEQQCRSGLGAETLDAQRRLKIIREVYARHYGNDAKAFGKAFT